MKIVVAIKEVARVADGFEIEDASVPEEHLTYALNEWDDYALAAARQVAAAHAADVEVVIVTVGPERCEGTVGSALARGADRAIRVWDDALASAEWVGPTATARVLAAAVGPEAPDLVLTGVQAVDDGFGATGVALAAELDLPWAAVVNDLDVDLAAGEAAVRRELEANVEELLTVPLPTVLTVQTGIAERRPDEPTSDDGDVERRTLADLGLDPSVIESGPATTALRKPERSPDLVGTSSEEAAAAVETALRDAGVGADETEGETE